MERCYISRKSLEIREYKLAQFSNKFTLVLLVLNTIFLMLGDPATPSLHVIFDIKINGVILDFRIITFGDQWVSILILGLPISGDSFSGIQVCADYDSTFRLVVDRDLESPSPWESTTSSRIKLTSKFSSQCLSSRFESEKFLLQRQVSLQRMKLSTSIVIE